MSVELVKALECAVREFNRLHGAEGQVRVLEVKEGKFKVEFRGSFCLTCGFYDYFEDFAYVLASCGARAGILAVEEEEGGAIVEYKLLKEGEEWRFAPERVFLVLEPGEQ
ncbi:MAG: hypothetical protein QXX83_04445 [Thermofilum sp.]